MYNRVIIIGRLTMQPELMTTSSEKSVTRAILAVNCHFKSQNDEHEVDFISAVVQECLAEALTSYAGKGSLLPVGDEFRIRKYEKDGHMDCVTEMPCRSSRLLESRTQRAMRENNVANDLADLILEEEGLLF